MLAVSAVSLEAYYICLHILYIQVCVHVYIYIRVSETTHKPSQLYFKSLRDLSSLLFL